MKKLTQKEVSKLKSLVEEMTGKGWEDIAPCDIIKTIQMLGQLADEMSYWLCQKNL